MGIQVAAKKQHLKKQHARCPDRRHDAKPRQDVVPKNRLHLEKQEGTGKDGDSKMELQAWFKGDFGFKNCLRHTCVTTAVLIMGQAGWDSVITKVAVRHWQGTGKGTSQTNESRAFSARRDEGILTSRWAR